VDVLLSPSLVEIRWLEVALWQWIALLLLVPLAWALSWVVAAVVVRAARPFVQRSRTTLDEKLLASMLAPVRLGVALLVFGTAVLALRLPPPAVALVTAFDSALTIVVLAWATLRLVDVSASVAMDALVARGRAAAVSIVPLGSKAAKVAILGFALLAILQNVGINVTGLLAGLGIGGLAVALAAQKTVENLFGGVTLIVDQPVRVGDFCRFGDRVGTVEEIGLRSTRVRTLDRTVVSIPNSQFAAEQLENFSRRDRIWLHTTIGLRYETTPDQLRWILLEIRTMLYAHPKVHPDPARIRFVGFGAYSLDCEIFAYVLTADHGEFLAIQEDIYLRIMDIVAASGSGFAFPSQTAYLASDTGVDEGRRDHAESQVRAWRERHELHLPEFPPETIEKLRATLPYPADGPRSGDA
jgi:MscS family membrane protein